MKLQSSVLTSRCTDDESAINKIVKDSGPYVFGVVLASKLAVNSQWIVNGKAEAGCNEFGLTLLYDEARQNFLKGYYPCKEKDTVYLAAISTKILYGNTAKLRMAEHGPRGEGGETNIVAGKLARPRPPSNDQCLLEERRGL
ncbi:unnamed protein product [Haemonchus placei]|uniref:FERM_M domain-containing protein n=1 Tax=Haemonchus placei TaxID=6290 RepID=A0A0N4WEF7_HAEPC|nr:unnamed protein product [Haemonchus placei]